MARGIVRYSLYYQFIGVDKKATQTAKDVAEGIENTGKAANDAKGPIGKHGQGLQALAGAYNALIVAKRAYALIAAGIKPAMELESATAKLTVATGLQGEALDKLVTGAEKAASVTPFAPAEAIDAVRKLQLATGDANTAVELLIPTLSMASVYMENDFKKASQVVSQIVAGFGMSGKEAARGLDQMIAASQAAGVPVQDLEKGFKKLGLASYVSGSSFEEMLPAYVLGARVFKDASAASTGILTGVQNLVEAKKRQALEEALGIDITNKATGGMQGMTTVMTKLAEKAEQYRGNWGAFQTVLRETLTRRAAKPFLATLKALNDGIVDTNGNVLRGAEAFMYMAKRMKDSDALLQENTERMMQTFEGRLRLLEEAWGKLRAAVFMPILKIISPIVSGIKYIAETITGLVKSTNPLAQLIVSIGRGAVMAAAAIMTVVGAKLAWKAAARIAATALKFLGVEATGLFGILSMSTIAGGAGGFLQFLKRIGPLALSGVAWVGMLRKAFNGLKAVLIGLTRSLGGWISILMIAFEVGKYVYDAFGKKAPKKSDARSAIEQQNRDIKAIRGIHAQTILAQAAAGRELTMRTEHLDRVVSNWAKVIEKQTPILSTKALGVVTGGVRSKLGTLTGSAAADVEDRIKTIENIFKGGFVDEMSLKQGQEALGVLALTMRTMGYTGERTEKVISSLRKEMVDLAQNSDALGVTFFATSKRAQGVIKDVENQHAAAMGRLEQLRGAMEARYPGAFKDVAPFSVARPEQIAAAIPVMQAPTAYETDLIRMYQDEYAKEKRLQASLNKFRGIRAEGVNAVSKALTKGDKEGGALPTEFSGNNVDKAMTYWERMEQNTGKTFKEMQELVRVTKKPMKIRIEEWNKEHSTTETDPSGMKSHRELYGSSQAGVRVGYTVGSR